LKCRKKGARGNIPILRINWVWLSPHQWFQHVDTGDSGPREPPKQLRDQPLIARHLRVPEEGLERAKGFHLQNYNHMKLLENLKARLVVL
jgi:hypothetical protein